MGDWRKGYKGHKGKIGRAIFKSSLNTVVRVKPRLFCGEIPGITSEKGLNDECGIVECISNTAGR